MRSLGLVQLAMEALLRQGRRRVIPRAVTALRMAATAAREIWSRAPRGWGAARLLEAVVLAVLVGAPMRALVACGDDSGDSADGGDPGATGDGGAGDGGDAGDGDGGDEDANPGDGGTGADAAPDRDAEPGGDCAPAGRCTLGPPCGDSCCNAGEECVEGECRCGNGPACTAEESCETPGPMPEGGCGLFCCGQDPCPQG